MYTAVRPLSGNRPTLRRPMTESNDSLFRFLLPTAGVRGVHVRLQSSWQQLQSHGAYPPLAKALLGEACVASALFTGHTKVDGRLSIQLRSSSALRTLFAECTAAGTVRGIARLEDNEDAPQNLQALGEDAVLAITIENPGLDPREPQRYQSLVALDAATLDEAFEAYFRQSEQLPTRLLLAADGDSAAGLLLQKLPGDEGDEDGWLRVSALFETLGKGELLATPAEALVHRLFHEEQPESMGSKPLAFAWRGRLPEAVGEPLEHLVPRHARLPRHARHYLGRGERLSELRQNLPLHLGGGQMAHGASAVGMP